MAGNYLDAPNNRLAWDIDGTQLYWSGNAVDVNQYDQGTMTALNREGTAEVVGGVGGRFFYFFFPRLMDITAMHVGASWNASTSGAAAWSADTTNGADGTWTSFSNAGWWHSGNGSTGNSKISQRQEIGPVGLSAIRCLRLYLNTGGGVSALQTVHLYGRPAAGQNSDRVEFWHPTLDQRVDPARFDWGNAQRNSSADVTFRVKNLSSSLTANNVVLSFDALTNTSPSVPAQQYVSDDGTNFFATRTIPALAPGAISGVYTLRRVTPVDAVLSLWWARLLANVTTWS
jgi:hypothetical protein